MDIILLFKSFITIYFSNIILCKEIELKSDSSAIKLDECRRCRILTDSFKYWIDKTSRGKYEGGDSAWEETKLKLYARSEVRLVEIQEGLCSEIKADKDKDKCYLLAEETEQVLEKWWVSENPDTSDLYTWICIDNIKYCCPKHHFGELCLPCLFDINNKVCGDRGKCDGDGTRFGNGTCICKRGYVGKYCEECDENFYRTSEDTCNKCHLACNGCSGEGAAACITCKSGWELDSHQCIDINECLDSSVCKLGQFCDNLEGSFVCRKCDKSCNTCLGRGSSNCTSCESKSVLWTGTCFDEESRYEFLISAFQRILLYFGLFCTTLIIFQRSNLLGSLLVIVVAVFFYFFENRSRFNIIDTLLIYYKS